MLITCPECEKKITVDDDRAGKKIKCPKCASVIAVAAKAAAKKTRPPADEDDESNEDAGEGKKSNKGLLIGAAVGVVLLLFVLCGGGAGGAWFFFFRTPTDSKQPDGPGGAEDPAATKINIANARIERIMDKLRLTVDYDAVKVHETDRVGCFVVFPGDPHGKLARIATPKDLQDMPKGQWVSVPFEPADAARDATECDIVVRTGPEFNALGKEIARLAKVNIPQSKVSSQLSNIVVRKLPNDTRRLEISFDHKLIGGTPSTRFLAVEIEFIEPGTNKRIRGLLTQRNGEIAMAETIKANSATPFPEMRTCDLLVSDRTPGGNGNLAIVKDIPIQEPAPPPAPAVVLSNAKVEYDSEASSMCRVSVDVAAREEPKAPTYRCWILFREGLGSKQKPSAVGEPISAQSLKAGVRVSVDNVAIPPFSRLDLCDLMIADDKGTYVGQLLNVPMTVIAKKKQPLVLLSNVRVDKIDGNAVRVRLDYEFTKTPGQNLWYYFKIFNGLPKATVTGAFFYQSRGDKLPAKGSIDQVYRQTGMGGYESYRIWVTRWDNEFDDPIVAPISQMLIVKAGVAETPKDVLLSNVRVDKLDNNHVRVSVDYEFTKGPDPKKSYALVERDDIDPAKAPLRPPVRQELGDKWLKKGQVKADVQADGKGDKYRVWMVETSVTNSNTVVVTAGQGGRDDGNEPIQIASAKLTSFGKKGSVIEVTFKFTGLNKPNAKSVYAFMIQPKGAAATPFFQAPGAKMAAQGTFPLQSTFVLGAETVIEVFVVESTGGNRLVSNKVMVEVKKN